MSKKYLLIIFFILISCLNNAEDLHSGMDKSQIDVVYRWAYGSNLSNFLVDNLLYVGNGGTLQILDISDPNFPEFINEIITDGVITEIKIHDEKAFVKIDDNKIQIIDVSDSNNLNLLGTFESQDPESFFYDFVIKDNYFIIADGENGLLIVNFENTNNPILSSSYDTNDLAKGIILEDNNLFISNNESLLILDASDPANLTEISSCEASFLQLGSVLCYYDDTIYYADSGSWSRIDVSDLFNPSQIDEGHQVSTNDITDIAVIDNYICLTIINEGFSIYSPPINAYDEIYTYDTSINSISSGANNLIISDNFAIVGDWYNGVHLIDISEIENLTELSFHSTASYTYDFKIEENLAYVAAGSYGILIFDISNPANPIEINHINLPGWNYSYSLEITENYIFICNGWAGITILNKTTLEEVGTYDINKNIRNVQISENEELMYLPARESGFKIVDIQDPSDIIFSYCTFEAPEGSDMFDVIVENDIAYVSDYHGKYYIFDVSETTSLSLLSTIQTSENGGNHMALSFPYLYVADGDEGMQVINVTDPSNPIHENNFDCNGSFGWNVSITDNYLFFTEILHIYDISDPSDPQLLDFIDLNGEGTAAVEVDGYIYLANGNGGFYVIAYDPTDIDESNIVTTSDIELSNYPNPFRPTLANRNAGTTISFSLSKSSNVDLAIYNIKGQKIKTLTTKELNKGKHSLIWNGLNNQNQPVSSGVYFYKVVIDGKSEYSKRCLLLK